MDEAPATVRGQLTDEKHNLITPNKYEVTDKLVKVEDFVLNRKVSQKNAAAGSGSGSSDSQDKGEKEEEAKMKAETDAKDEIEDKIESDKKEQLAKEGFLKRLSPYNKPVINVILGIFVSII